MDQFKKAAEAAKDAAKKMPSGGPGPQKAAAALGAALTAAAGLTLVSYGAYHSMVTSKFMCDLIDNKFNSYNSSTWSPWRCV